MDGVGGMGGDMNVPHKAKRRFTSHTPIGKRIISLPNNHKVVIHARTLFPNRVVPEPTRGTHILKSGEHSRKLGSHVTKGKWTGMPIYSLTLEERATCPSSCSHWNNCYGNKMQWSERYIHGQALEARLEKELAELNKRFHMGFVVRLHVLGDFYSRAYVMKWAEWMDRFSALRVFGYTARDPHDDIGEALKGMRDVYMDRWWIRWSDRDDYTYLSTGPSGIICPVQTEKAACCGECGLCWAAVKPIRFLLH